MTKIKKSDYISYSRTLVRKLFSVGCFGRGSMYEDNLLSGLPDGYVAKKVLEALVKQAIILKKRKKYGWKYFLNEERLDKIKEIAKEKGHGSIIPLLLCL